MRMTAHYMLTDICYTSVYARLYMESSK